MTRDIPSNGAAWASAVLVAASIVFAPVSVSGQDMTRAAAQIAEGVSAAQKKSIAVVDFTDLQMQVSELGRYLAEELQAALIPTARAYTVIDRTHLKAILQEHRLAGSGVIDPLTARQVGKIAGVDVLVTGSITPLSETIRVSVKALDASTAAVIAMSTMDIPRTGAISALIAQPVASGAVSGEAGTASSRGPATRGASPGATPKTPVTTSARGIEVRIEQCARKGGAVACTGFLTNGGNDAPLYISTRGSQLWDNEGNEYGVERITIGNKQLSSALVTSVRLVSGVMTRFTIDVDGDVTGSAFSRILLRCQTEGPDFDFVLRDVPIQ